MEISDNLHFQLRLKNWKMAILGSKSHQVEIGWNQAMVGPFRQGSPVGQSADSLNSLLDSWFIITVS